MPHKRPKVEYSDRQFQFKVPFIMYADFESILELISPEGPGSLCDPLLDQVTILGSLQLETSTSMFHLDGAFTASLLM